MRPIVPEDLNRNGRAVSTAFTRAVLAQARASFGPERNAARVAQKLWPNDRQAMDFITTRGASTVATTAGATWAAPLTSTGIADLLPILAPAAAGPALLQRAIPVALERHATITVPGMPLTMPPIPFTAEGAPIPVRQFDLSTGASLKPRKLPVAFVLSREIIEHSAAQAVTTAVVAENIRASIDAWLFDANAGDAVRPAGLRNGVAAIAAGASMSADLAALAAAVAPAGMDLVFIAAPGEAVKIALTAGPQFQFSLLGSSALAAKTVLCVAANALVTAGDPEPRIETSRDATVHMEGQTPQPISIAGAPPVMAAPVASMYQTDTVSIRLILDIDWALRGPGIAWTQNVSW